MSPEWPWLRQTPGGAGIWNDAQFVIDRPFTSADWWVVYDDLPNSETVECAKTVLITPEPPAHKTYSREFAAQFDCVITSDRSLVHPNKIHSQQGLPWHVGRLQNAGKNISFSKSYDELKSFWPVPKTKEISVIASDKAATDGHRARRDFVRQLQEHFGDRLEVFGWGGREIPDKWDGIAPFRYHIAMENSAAADYWTEKLSDAYLAGAFPIYFGCPNITNYFPPDSIAPFDFSIPQIEKILADDPASRCDLKPARDLILDRYNLFPMLAEFCAKSPSGDRAMRTIQPSSHFYRPPGLARRAVKKLRRVITEIDWHRIDPDARCF